MDRSGRLNVLISGLLGVALGVFISLIMHTWFEASNFVYAPRELINRTGSSLNAAWLFFIGTFVFGVGFYAISLLTGATNLGLWKESILHLTLCFIWFILGGYLLGFGAYENWTSLWVSTSIFVIIYVIIWLAIYFHIKRTLAEINKKLRQ